MDREDIPVLWPTAVHTMLERYDRARAEWKPTLDGGGALLHGLYMNNEVQPVPGDDSQALLELVFASVFEHIPPNLWGMVPAPGLLNSIAKAVAQARAAGDESVVPTYRENFALAGFCLITRERNLVLGLRSNSAYLADRLGFFYTRRHMGTGQAETHHGHISNDLPDDEAERQADEDPDFHLLHAKLANLTHACLAPPEECRRNWGEAPVTGAEMADVAEQVKAHINPFHPRNPMRAN